MSTAPKLSVCLLTYNHERYIAQAIESIIEQRTDFPIEIIIADDYSTDNTRSIAKSYAKKYPDLIRLLLQKSNVGHSQNFYDLIGEAKGQYIANLDGDDYWTNPFKLQRQVDFLEAHHDYVGCAHNVQMIYQTANKAPQLVNGENTLDTVTIKDYARGNAYFHASSMVYRNVYDSKLPKIVLDERCGCGDWFFGMLNLQSGNIKYLNEVMSVYRIHPEGLWSKMTVAKQRIKNAENALFYRNFFAPSFYGEFSKSIYRNCLSAIDILQKQPDQRSRFLIAKYSLLRDFVDLKEDNPGARYRRKLAGLGFTLLSTAEQLTAELFALRQPKQS
jgi:glycosyltransferase involved in cell wall biosynthesis